MDGPNEVIELDVGALRTGADPFRPGMIKKEGIEIPMGKISPPSANASRFLQTAPTKAPPIILGLRFFLSWGASDRLLTFPDRDPGRW